MLSGESFTPIGSNLPGYDNYFCRDCRRIVHGAEGIARLSRVPDPWMHAAEHEPCRARKPH